MRDQDGFAAISQLIKATRLFAVVLNGRRPDRIDSNGQDFPRAWLKPTRWRESSLDDPETKTRTVSFDLTLTVSGEPEAEAVLDQLATAVQNAVGGQGLGFCLPELTELSEGSYPGSDRHPNLSLILSGRFAYLLTGDAGRDSSSRP